MPLNDDIADHGICSPAFVLNGFSGLFLYPSNFSIKDSRSAYITIDITFLCELRLYFVLNE